MQPSARSVEAMVSAITDESTRSSSARDLLAPVRSKADGSARAHEKNQASTVGLKLAVNECEVRDKHTATRHSHDRK